MKMIFLTQGKTALVDDEDYDYLNQWKWHANKTRDTFYAARLLTKILMHRVVMKTPEEMEVDHIDGNGLNNQKINLRNCTHTENQMNRHSKIGSSNFLGVHWYKTTKKWKSAIAINGKIVSLGYFSNEEDAARAYDEAAKKYHGEFANLNFK